MSTVPTPADIARELARSDERDAWQRVSLARERESFDRGYRAGRQDGYRAGREDQAAETAADWHEMAGRIARGDSRSFAELESLRRGDAA